MAMATDGVTFSVSSEGIVGVKIDVDRDLQTSNSTLTPISTSTKPCQGQDQGQDVPPFLDSPSSPPPPPLILPDWMEVDPNWGNHYETVEQKEEYVCALSEALKRSKLCPEQDSECYCGHSGSNYSAVLFKKPFPPPPPQIYVPELLQLQERPMTMPTPTTSHPDQQEVVMYDQGQGQFCPGQGLFYPGQGQFYPVQGPFNPGQGFDPTPTPTYTPTAPTSLKDALMDPDFPLNLNQFSRMGLDEISQHCNLGEFFDTIANYLGLQTPSTSTPAILPQKRTSIAAAPGSVIAAAAFMNGNLSATGINSKRNVSTSGVRPVVANPGRARVKEPKPKRKKKTS